MTTASFVVRSRRVYFDAYWQLLVALYYALVSFKLIRATINFKPVLNGLDDEGRSSSFADKNDDDWVIRVRTIRGWFAGVLAGWAVFYFIVAALSFTNELTPWLFELARVSRSLHALMAVPIILYAFAADSAPHRIPRWRFWRRESWRREQQAGHVNGSG